MSPEHVWLWFAENGNIRKWSSEPFAEGAPYVNAAQVAEARRQALEAGAAQTAIIQRAQRIMIDYLRPDGIGGPRALDKLLELLDGPEQRAAQEAWDGALVERDAPA